MSLENERIAFETMVGRVPMGPKESKYKRLRRRKEWRLAYLQTADTIFASIPESTTSPGVIEKRTPLVPISLGEIRIEAQVVRTIYLDGYGFDRFTSIEILVERDDVAYELFSVEELLEPDLLDTKFSFHAQTSRIRGQNGFASDKEVLEGMLAIRFLSSQLGEDL